MLLTEFEEKAAIDKLEGWELVEFLQIPIEHILSIAYEYDWIDEDNLEDVLDLIGLRPRRK